MINYNLRKYGYKNHPLEYKWGFLLQNNMYANHLCTVVDNHNEIINGKYTHEPAILLLHMSPDVRKYVSAKLFDEFLYVMIWYDSDVPTYTNWGYKYQEYPFVTGYPLWLKEEMRKGIIRQSGYVPISVYAARPPGRANYSIYDANTVLSVFFDEFL